MKKRLKLLRKGPMRRRPLREKYDYEFLARKICDGSGPIGLEPEDLGILQNGQAAYFWESPSAGSVEEAVELARWAAEEMTPLPGRRVLDLTLCIYAPSGTSPEDIQAIAAPIQQTMPQDAANLFDLRHDGGPGFRFLLTTSEGSADSERKRGIMALIAILRSRFKRRAMGKTSQARTELCCRTDYDRTEGFLFPSEWIGIAGKTGVQALVITDFQEVEGLWGTAWVAKKSWKDTEGPGLKIIYGLETMLEDGSRIHLLARRQDGLAQLYRLLELSWQKRGTRPFLRKAEIDQHRSGLLVGCPGEFGELYLGMANYLDDARLEEIAGFYDYLSVLPPPLYDRLCGKTHRAEDLIRKTIAIGKRCSRPVAATGSTRMPSQDWGMYRSSVAYGILRDEGGDVSGPLPDLLYTEELLDAYSFLGRNTAEEIVVHTPNRLSDLCENIQVFSEDRRRFQPILPGAFETIASLCREQLRALYGGEIPRAAQARLEREFSFLQNDELLCSVLLLSRHLIQGLGERGYLAVPRAYCSDSASAYLYDAYLLGITEADPLALGIPCEAFWGLDPQRSRWTDLEIALDVSVSRDAWETCWKDAAEIFNRIFPQGIMVSYGKQAGDSSHIYSSPKRKRILFPDAAELQKWVPLRKMDGECMIPYGDYEDYRNLFQLSLYPAKNLELLRRLEELTGVSQNSIHAEEALPLLLRDQTDIPGLGASDAQEIWKLADPQDMEDIIKVFALSDPFAPITAWYENGEQLIREGTAPFREIIGSWEDAFCPLLDAGVELALVHQVMDWLENHEGSEESCISTLRQSGLPEWFVRSCEKIAREVPLCELRPKAHNAATAAIPALKAAWYRAHFPEAYAQAYSAFYQ